MFSISEVALRIGIKRHRIAYAHQMGYLPEVARFQGARLYTEDDVRVVEEYFRPKGGEGERAADEPGWAQDEAPPGKGTRRGRSSEALRFEEQRY